MTNIPNETPESLDDRLADFTDQVLAGKTEQSASRADDELLSLEETILRLNQAAPRVELNETEIKHMYARLNARIRRESGQAKPTFWQKWFTGQRAYSHPRPQAAIMALILILGALALLITPMFSAGGPTLTATAFANTQTILTLGALAGVILLALWINRRK